MAFLGTDLFLSTFTAPVLSGFKGAFFIQTWILLLESSWVSDATGFLVLLLFLFKGLLIFLALILCSTMSSLTLVIVSRMNDTFLTESLRIVSPFPLSNFQPLRNLLTYFPAVPVNYSNYCNSKAIKPVCLFTSRLCEALALGIIMF